MKIILKNTNGKTCLAERYYLFVCFQHQQEFSYNSGTVGLFFELKTMLKAVGINMLVLSSLADLE